ncbi:PAS domain S-box-containing protein [Desulfonatronum zhilinae]|nr:PAS domain S-box-containing protein [Desulfonatronum zhilinae]
MSTTDDLALKKQQLRKQAEARVAEDSRSVENLSSDELKNLIHEYQVHQIELELQNEELRATQLRLEEVRDQYAELFNNAPAGYLVVNARGLITKANQTFARVIGREGHGFTDRLLTELVVPEDRPALLGRFKAFFNSPEGKRLDFRLFGPNDETVHVRCVGRRDMLAKVLPQNDEDDADQKLLLMVSDITDQVRSDEALKKSEAKYRELVENAPMGIFQSTPAGRYHTVNTEMARLCGYPTAKEMVETVTNIARQLYARPEDREIYKKKLLADGEVKNFETELLRRDGTTFWASMNTRMQHGKDGEVIFDGFLLDVTERCLAEQERHLSHQRLITVLDGIEALIYIVDMDTYEILFINAYGRKLCGDSAGKTCWKVLQQGQDGPCAFCTNDKLLKDGKPTGTHEWSFQNTRNQRWYLCQDSAIPWIDGRFVRMEIATDITDRKRIEDEVRRYSAELKALLAEKDKFFSIIAHDLKSPMSGLLSLAKIFAEEAEDMTTKELQEVASAMHKSTERLYDLLENLLHWALVQQGLMSFSPKQVSLHKLVHGSIESLRSVAELKRIAIKNIIPDKLEAIVDQPMITTVVRNLVSNALKYTGSGGAVTISRFMNGDMVEVAVRDTGTGMDQKTQANLFVLDRKTIRPGTHGEHGTGLGLILCKEFIEKHGGKIRVKSEVGQGTTFHFSLPAHE